MKRVLIVDDDFAVLAITKLTLEYEGFSVMTATNGEEALAEAQAETPDLIVTDFMMPFMNGAELARRIRALPSLAHIPIVMISATSSHEVGPLDARTRFLPKPVTLNALLRAIRDFLPDAE